MKVRKYEVSLTIPSTRKQEATLFCSSKESVVIPIQKSSIRQGYSYNVVVLNIEMAELVFEIANIPEGLTR